MLHVSASRKLILRTKIKINVGKQVYDEDIKSIGKVVDIFGPVENPYVSIKPSIYELEGYVGRFLYTLTENEKRKLRRG